MAKMKTSSKIIIIVLSVIVLGLIGVVTYGITVSNQRAEFDAIDTTILEKGDLDKVVFADGQVRAASYTQIYPTATGTVKEINVSENSEISKDDLLMKIEVTDQAGGTSIQEIKATIDGTVTNIWAKVENQVTPGQTPLIEVVNLDELNVEGLVLESDVNKVAVDQKVKLDFPALDENGDDTEYFGKVTYVAQSPFDVNSVNPSYQVSIEPDELPDGVKFGMTVNMEIIVDEIDNVLYVDNVYIYTEDGKDYIIRVVNRDQRKTENVEVDLGFEGENDTEILSGADESDIIMLPSVETGTSQAFFGN
ncbi:HlyD family efflux transporter periplasmic adaptor subunit [Patescibacteria group bacterium]|nr:HlyD family efflux transporter periplasmic adaptor subunit [Patescibacteria group bacterium]MBU1674034.1 HlyD family efflux transporter periplasmic adaptor subunit [Patescibacteria group bacterium]MBU1963182.1 HlyD family efflux transporter periplasmic adaptor subunit [Patescibacteria group bacterium]